MLRLPGPHVLMDTSRCVANNRPLADKESSRSIGGVAWASELTVAGVMLRHDPLGVVGQRHLCATLFLRSLDEAGRVRRPGGCNERQRERRQGRA